MALKRIQKELIDLCGSPMESCCVVPLSVDDYFTWNVAIQGPQDTPYENGIFFLRIKFPKNEYPLKAPRVIFVTKIYHPNINTVDGTICHDILNDNYSPAVSMR